MQIFRGIESIHNIEGDTAVTIGVFDGVHIGHQTIIKMAMDFADIINGKSVVITFEPHPIAVVNPERTPALLTATDLKAEYIEELGVDYLLIIPFTESFASMEPENFVDNVLFKKLHAKYVVIGEDFSFGKGRRGNTEFLNKYGQPKGLNVVVVPHIKKDSVVVSSTEVRARIAQGDIKGVTELTGRFPRFRGKVTHGYGRGSSVIGVPTANVETLYGEMLPRAGVYTGYAWVDHESLPCVIDVGVSPTFGDVAKTEIQVHIIGFKKDIYGKRIDIDLTDRLRDEKSFSGIDELKSQIRQDIEKAKEMLAYKSG
jgi:riboflavin kinase/FMN adenylyltransferase